MIGQPRFLFTSLDSTNSEAMRRVKLGANSSPHGCCIIADVQTQGRGRNGRIWCTMPQSLAMSVIFRPTQAINTPEIPAINAAQLSLVAAVAVHTALVAYAPMANIKIKWPNDILVDNKKLCGMLMELHTIPNNPHTVDAIVLGIGVNINTRQLPVTYPYPACALSELCNPAPQRDALADAICQQLETAWHTWLQYGFAPFRYLWQQAHAMQNKAVHIDTGKTGSDKGKVCGIALGLDDDGALLLDIGEGQTSRIIAGDVHAQLGH